MTRMNRFLLNGFLAATLVTTIPTLSHAIGFNINGVTDFGYTLTGMFSYSDTLINTALIDETALDTFMIEGFLGGVSIGSFTADVSQPDFGTGPTSLPFIFNFNTTSETFLIGGPNGTQAWNAGSDPGFGWVSGSNPQGIAQGPTVNDVSFASNQQDPFNNLTATRKQRAPIPEPSTLLLFGTGILGLLGYATCRKRQAQAAV